MQPMQHPSDGHHFGAAPGDKQVVTGGQQNGGSDLSQMQQTTEEASATGATNVVAPMGEDLTEEEKELAEWMKAAAKDSIATLNDSLKLTLTLSAALLGLLVTFADKGGLPLWSRALGSVFLLIAFSISLLGTIPGHFRNFPFLEDMRELREMILKRKAFCYYWGIGNLGLALLVFVIGVCSSFWAK